MSSSSTSFANYEENVDFLSPQDESRLCTGSKSDPSSLTGSSVANPLDRVKRRSCTRQSSSVPAGKYFCKQNSDSLQGDIDAHNMGITDVDSGNYCGQYYRSYNGSCGADSCSKSAFSNSHGLDNEIENTDSEFCTVFENGVDHELGTDWKTRSPCAVNCWGHFSQSVRNRYKYRRSDYSSDSDDNSPKNYRRSPSDSQYNSGPIKQKSHLPDCDLINVTPIAKKKDSEVGNSQCETRKNFTLMKDGVKPTIFREKLNTIMRWFGEFNDGQKNMIINRLLKDCELPQLHLLSVKMGSSLHHGCPPNCQDIITWLPTNLATKIMSCLDPVSLCQAAQVCKVWRYLTEEPSFWRKFCCQRKWRLSKAAEHKQVISHMSGGSIMWKKVFAERYRLRNNWLKGRCTVRTFEGHSQGISCVQFDDTRIVSGSSDKTIKVWNIRTNAPWSVQTLVGHSGTVRCLHLEGKRLVSGSTDKSIKVWDLSTQESWSSIACKVTMIGHSDTVRCLQVDDDKVISGSYDKTLKVWNIRTGECRMTLRGHQAAVLCVHFNDTKIVSGSCDKAIKVWNYEGACLRTLMGHQDAVTCLQFDSTRIISGSLDCNLKFWDIHTGACVNTIDWKAAEGHTGVVRYLQADSWRLVSAADDKTIKVWNLETGERLVTLRNHTDGVTCLQFNDFIIVSGSYDKTVKLWDFSCC